MDFLAILRRLGQFLSSLGINFIPAGGLFFAGWSTGTALVIYWFENVAASLFVALRIVLHRRLAPHRGHFHYLPRKGNTRGDGTLLQSFLPVSLIFSAVHGIFLVVLGSILTANGYGADVGLDWHELIRGCGGVLVLLTINFLIDLFTLRRRSFAWIEHLAELNLGRVILVHFTLVLGMGAAAITGVNKAVFAVFVGLKTMSDVSGYLPQWDPAVPPAWLCRIMDKIPAAKPGGPSFAAAWVGDRQDEAARQAANEQPA